MKPLEHVRIKYLCHGAAVTNYCLERYLFSLHLSLGSVYIGQVLLFGIVTWIVEGIQVCCCCQCGISLLLRKKVLFEFLESYKKVSLNLFYDGNFMARLNNVNAIDLLRV